MFYRPIKVIFEKGALNYPLGKKLQQLFIKDNVEIEVLQNNKAITNIGKTFSEKFIKGKNIIVVRIRKNVDFQSCKPSAHYQLPLLSGCIGKCEYCYLNTRFGKKPYVTIYANIEEILDKAKKYIEQRKPQITYFEASSTSDPIPFEKYTNSLEVAIKFFSREEYARLRFVTKFSQINNLLSTKHNGHTTIRFSINSSRVIKNYEHGTSKLEERIGASKKVLDHGYELGFIIGPVFLYENWEKEYGDMLKIVRERLGEKANNKISFEVISHRFTKIAKKNILEVFPNTTLPMIEENRIFKYGKFGYGKYLYPEKEQEQIKTFFAKNIKQLFVNGNIDYII